MLLGISCALRDNGYFWNMPHVPTFSVREFGGFWWLLVVAASNFSKHNFNHCRSAICKFLSRDTKSARDKNGTKPRKNKVKTLCPKYPLWKSSSFAKVQICSLKNEGKSLFLSFTTHFPTIVPQMWFLQTVLTSNSGFLKTTERRIRTSSLDISMTCLIWCQGMKEFGCRMVGWRSFFGFSYRVSFIRSFRLFIL